MSTAWRKMTLGTCVTFLSGGTPSKSKPDYWNGDIPWVSSGEMTQERIQDTSLHITEDAARHGSRLVPAKTVLVVVRGMSLAKEFRISITQRAMTFNQDIKALRCEPDIAPLFLFYALRHNRHDIREHATEASHGTKKLETAVLSEFMLDIPDMIAQRRIADILSAYDDLIENNRRRMALLEEAARMIYREWFVRLRFPGHETARIVDGVPEGWEKRIIKDIGQVVTGKTPSTTIPENYGGSIPFVKTPDMHGNVFVTDTSATLSQRGGDTQKNKYITPGSIMVSCIGTIGVVSIASERCQTNQQINSLVPLHVSNTYYSYYTLKSLKDAMEALGGGATMPNVNKNKFECMEVLWPTANLRTGFHIVSDPMFQQILNLQKQNQKLQQARDILLPKLMSGEIEVSETADTMERELVTA